MKKYEFHNKKDSFVFKAEFYNFAEAKALLKKSWEKLKKQKIFPIISIEIVKGDKEEDNK